MRTRPFVYLHACAVIPECDCGDREWEVEPPDGCMFATPQGIGPFGTLVEAYEAAATMRPSVDYVPLPLAGVEVVKPCGS